MLFSSSSLHLKAIFLTINFDLFSSFFLGSLPSFVNKHAEIAVLSKLLPLSFWKPRTAPLMDLKITKEVVLSLLGAGNSIFSTLPNLQHKSLSFDLVVVLGSPEITIVLLVSSLLSFGFWDLLILLSFPSI